MTGVFVYLFAEDGIYLYLPASPNSSKPMLGCLSHHIH